MTAPPPAASRKSPPTPKTDVAAAEAAIAVRRETRAVASLKSDSPSRDRHEAPWQPDASADRGGGDGIRGRDDRADRQGRRPAQIGQQPVHRGADGEGRRDDEPDGPQEDRAPVRREVTSEVWIAAE